MTAVWHRHLLSYVLLLATPTARALAPVRPMFRSRRGQAVRYWIATRVERREPSSFTQFLRLPTQLAALAGPVLDHLGGPGRREPLRVAVLGCSRGAEPYTISSILRSRHPGLAFVIDAYDRDPAVLEDAARGVYSPRQVLRSGFVDWEFVGATFEVAGGAFQVRAEVAERVRFHHCDLLDPRFADAVPAADVVCAQNILLNMQRGDARRAFDHIVSVVRAPGALLIDGMDLDMRTRRARAGGLLPLTVEVERIHCEARVLRGCLYPWHATGLEPYQADRADAAWRYATIFLRPAPDRERRPTPD